MVDDAGRGAAIPGKALGPKPRFFIVGDCATARDLVTGMPFSGSLRDVMHKAIIMLAQKYQAEATDCYITYLIKVPVIPSKMDEKEIWDTWLPIARLEYKLSGCETVVAIGKIARMYAGHIGVKDVKVEPAVKSSFLDRMKLAWQILKT